MYSDTMGSTAQVQQYCLRWNNHRSNLLNLFDELLCDDAFTDCTLSCDGGMAKCHRMVLAACSSYFQSLFGTLPCMHAVVVLKDMKYADIIAILEYMYHGEVNIAQDQLAALLKVAEALNVKGLVEEHGNSDEHKRRSPSVITSTNYYPQADLPTSSNNGSPPHATVINGQSGCPTKFRCSVYAKSPVNEPEIPAGEPVWTPCLHRSSNPTRPSAFAAAMLSGCYRTNIHDIPPLKKKKISSLLMTRDTPILRTVLGQGQVDCPQPVSLVCRPDRTDVPMHENDKILRNEPSEEAQSPHTDISIADDDEKPKLAQPSTSPQQSYPSDAHAVSSGIATYVPTQKPEWKRYKQYTRNDIMCAIEAVRTGMSALQAARKYGVPSRTLYDKVKKLGITTSRPFRRGTNGSNASFPYGLSGTNSPYSGHVSEGEDLPMSQHHPAALLEASLLQHALDTNRPPGLPGRPTNIRSPNSSPSFLQYIRQTSLTPSPTGNGGGVGHHRSDTNGGGRDDDRDDQVEDLSMQRKEQHRVIMSPTANHVSTIIKKEDAGVIESLRREIHVDEAN